MVAININTSKPYCVDIESENFDTFADRIIPKDKNYLAVISQKVEKLYGKLLNIPSDKKFILKDGEKEKNFKNYLRILDRAFKLGLKRNDTFLAIGGGVVGDLTGFAAATYMRGIGYIQVPTTLLSCVDSSVGGKTAVNTDYGKNLVGAFYQPDEVFINPEFLKTLDDKQFKSGLGEVIKYGFIERSCFGEYNLLGYLSENCENILKRDEKILSRLIEICINLKKSVVERDEKEKDLRRILNFGHTLAHAIEKITDYKKHTHGEAVVEGMKFAFDAANRKGLIDENYKFFALDLIQKFGFEDLPKYDMQKLSDLMKSDKKANANSIVFVLPTDYAAVQAFEIAD